MLPNINPDVYQTFKNNGYMIKNLRRTPVESIGDIVKLGYRDVCRTMRGISNARELSKSIKQCVVAFITDLQNRPPTSQSELDRLHQLCCEECIQCREQYIQGCKQQCIMPFGVEVHYGQAQKIVNMSLKYWYNEFALYGERNLGFPNNNMEYFFHLPIDNQILSHLVRCCDFRRPTTLPWSKWEYDHYVAFQTELRDRLINNHKPLEIDYMLWNGQNQSLENAIRPA